MNICCENYVLRWRDNKDSGRNDAYAVGAIPLHRHHLSQNPNLFSVREFLMCLWEASLTLDFHRLSSLSKGTLTWNSSTCDAFYHIEKVENSSYVVIPDMTVFTHEQELATRLYGSATLLAGLPKCDHHFVSCLTDPFMSRLQHPATMRGVPDCWYKGRMTCISATLLSDDLSTVNYS